MNNNVRVLLMSSVIGFGLAGGLIPSLAFAQAAATAQAPQATTQSPADSGEIVVTARKTSENILKTPVAISALTSADIQARGIVSLADISAYTPGMKVVDNGAGRNDRSFQQLIIRGFTPPNALAQTTSVFIDGVPVSSATAVSSITDPERVEILKGPQSAYFGRQTFAGALNVVTKGPTDHWTGTVEGLLGTRNNHDEQASISGPLIEDVLGIRATVREYGKDGSYQNAGVPGQTLGDQETKTGTLSLVFKPASNFTAKAFGLLTTGKDGPSAQGLIGAYTVTGATGNTVIQSQSNCTLNGLTFAGTPHANAFICGTTPGLINSPSANTTNDSVIKNFLANPKGRLVDPEDGVQGYGLVSRYYHLHLAMDWTIGGVTLSSLTGMNRERYSLLTDLDNVYDTSQPNVFGSPGSRSYFDFPFLVEQKTQDWSQELRASFDKGPFKVTVGGSYLDATYQNGLGGGNNNLGVDTFSAVQGKSENKTLGAFYGVSFKITDKLTLSTDGRYQIDHLYAYAPDAGVTIVSPTFAPVGYYAGGAVLQKRTFKNFLPRAIVQYDFSRDAMVYASFAKGINPGAFNTQFLTSGTLAQQVAAADGYKIVVEPEKLDNYEIGFKGKLFGNRIRYSFAAYRAIWTNQINSASVIVFDPTTQSTTSVTATLNAGRVRMTGIEGQATAFVAKGLTFDFGGAINDSHIETLSAPNTTQLTGITNFEGKQNPLTSKYSAVVSGEYRHAISSLSDTNAYIRGDFSYKSGVYSDAANILKTPPLKLVNVRVGITNRNTTIEAFATNVFNTHTYTSVADGTEFNNTFTNTTYSSAAVVALPDLRTLGLRMRYSFGK